jgi:hypothetical protein
LVQPETLPRSGHREGSHGCRVREDGDSPAANSESPREEPGARPLARPRSGEERDQPTPDLTTQSVLFKSVYIGTQKALPFGGLLPFLT